MAYSPYKAAGAATNWIEDYFKLSRKQKEAIALGKEQKGKTRVKFSKEVEGIRKSMKRAQSKRKKGWFEKAFGDYAPLITTLAGAITGNPALLISGATMKGVKKGYDIDQQAKHTRRRSGYSLAEINKAMPKFAGTFIQPESTLGPSKDAMTDRYEAADKMRNPLNILLQAGVERAKTYAMGKMAHEAGSGMFTNTAATPEVINTATSGGLTGITSITPAVEASRAFTPFKALAGGGIKDLWEDEGTNMMMLLISSLLQEGMEG